MDSLISAAARALAAGDPIDALNRIALRNDPAALALRGIAMAQLGELARARLLLRRAARRFGPRETLARARCVVAESEIALVARDLHWRPGALSAARVTLERHGDFRNAAHARYLEARRLLLIGRLGQAEKSLAKIAAAHPSPALHAALELMAAGIAVRRLHTRAAQAALERAAQAARQVNIPALSAEVGSLRLMLSRPAGRVIEAHRESYVRLEEIEAIFASRALVVDGIRRAVHGGRTTVSLASRPMLFTLLRALAEAWPSDATRAELISRAFRGRRADESHRARLRVEMGRLRRFLGKLADVSATVDGFALVPRRARRVLVLARPVDHPHAALLALLGDGEAWSSSALALALGASQRSVQRALDTLTQGGKAHAFGRGRAQRWMATPVPGFATALLLPVAMPHG